MEKGRKRRIDKNIMTGNELTSTMAGNRELPQHANQLSAKVRSTSRSRCIRFRAQCRSGAVLNGRFKGWQVLFPDAGALFTPSYAVTGFYNRFHKALCSRRSLNAH